MRHHMHSDWCEGRHFMGRHRGGRGYGHVAFGFGAGHGGRGFRSGRRLAAEDLQLIILALLAEKPHHGYEIIKALEGRSRGFYAPSPGMVYPALTYLDETGYATSEAEGTKKLYHISETGRAHFERNRALADSLLSQLERIGRRMDRVREYLSGEDADAELDETERDARRESEREVFDARRNLRAALREADGSAPEERKRIAAILRRAADDIRKK